MYHFLNMLVVSRMGNRLVIINGVADAPPCPS